MKRLIKTKAKANILRKRGKSIRDIALKLRVSKSTLSFWFKDIILTEKQNQMLRKRWVSGLVNAREKAVLVHNKKKQERIEIARANAEILINNLDIAGREVKMLALSMLFAGEGFKAAEETSLGNSDTKIVKSFLKLLSSVYVVDKEKLRIYLHLRADQNVDLEIKFWSKILEIKPNYFKIAPVDKRTVGKETYPGYHGVCVIRYYDVSIKRELLAFADKFFEKVIN